MGSREMTSFILTPWALSAFCQQYPSGAKLLYRDVYQFGVYTGGSLSGIVRDLRSLNVSFGTLWGFDSFEGLPSERFETNATAAQTMGQLEGNHWKPGAWSAADALGVSSYTELRSLLTHKVGRREDDGPLRLMRGFFSETLKPNLAATMRMQPALFVDIDSDLYVSAIQALEWLFCSGLVVAGETVIRYDDWVGFNAKHKRIGEKRAHGEITARHRVGWAYFGGDPSVLRCVSYTLDTEHCDAQGYHSMRALLPTATTTAALERGESLLPTPRSYPTSAMSSAKFTGQGRGGGGGGGSGGGGGGGGTISAELERCHTRIGLWTRKSITEKTSTGWGRRVAYTKEEVLSNCNRMAREREKQSWALGMYSPRTQSAATRPTVHDRMALCTALQKQYYEACFGGRCAVLRVSQGNRSPTL